MKEYLSSKEQVLSCLLYTSARAYPVIDGQCDFREYIDLTDHVGTGYQDEIFQLSGLTAYNRKRFFTGVASQYLYWTAPELSLIHICKTPKSGFEVF